MSNLVGDARFELAASCSQSKRATTALIPDYANDFFDDLTGIITG